MRIRIAIVLLAAGFAASTILQVQRAQADDCAERFRALLTKPRSEGPVKIHVTQAVKGGPTTTNYNYQTGTGDWLTEMIEPATMPWTLVRNNVRYVSNDAGKSWSKVGELDSKAGGDASKLAMKEAAGTVRNASCGVETIDGVKLDVVAADYDVPQYKTSHRDTYWVDPATGWIQRAKSVTKMASFESTVMQVIQRLPEVELPMP